MKNKSVDQILFEIKNSFDFQKKLKEIEKRIKEDIFVRKESCKISSDKLKTVINI